MALEPLASTDDLATFLGIVDGFTEDEEPRAQMFVEFASTSVRAYAGKTFEDVDPLPDGIVQATVLCAARAWVNPHGATSQAAGPFSESLPTADLFALTDAEQALIDGSSSSPLGIWTLGTTRGPLETDRCLDDQHLLPTTGGAGMLTGPDWVSEL